MEKEEHHRDKEHQRHGASKDRKEPASASVERQTPQTDPAMVTATQRPEETLGKEAEKQNKPAATTISLSLPSEDPTVTEMTTVRDGVDKMATTKQSLAADVQDKDPSGRLHPDREKEAGYNHDIVVEQPETESAAKRKQRKKENSGCSRLRQRKSRTDWRQAAEDGRCGGWG